MDKEALNPAAKRLSPAEQLCLESFRAYVQTIYREEVGVLDEVLANTIAEEWFSPDARHEHRFAELRKRLPEGKRILDLASGMGTAVLYGLSQGFDVFGIEPDPRKLRFAGERIDAGGMPAQWRFRFQRAVGEQLPFRDGSFDAVLSYQTLEHVQDPDIVLSEMLRVVRPGGALHIRCPDYRGTFEGHYLLPWLPLMPRALARLYLRMLRKPLTGFNGIRYTTGNGMVNALRAAERRSPGLHLKIADLEAERFLHRLRERRLPAGYKAFRVWKAVRYFRDLFRREMQVDLWIRVEKRFPRG